MTRLDFFTQWQMRLSTCGTWREFYLNCLSLNNLLPDFPLPLQQVSLPDLALSGAAFKVDRTALLLMPENRAETEGLVPLLTLGDGNCLPRAASYHAFGSEIQHVEMRVRLAVAMAVNKEQILNTVWFAPFKVTENSNQGEDPMLGEEIDLNELARTHTDDLFDDSKSMGDCFEREAMATAEPAFFCGFWQVAALVFVLEANVQNVYPPSGRGVENQWFGNALFRHPVNPDSRSTYTIMWSGVMDEDNVGETFLPNHFVPLVPVNSMNHGFLDE